MSQLAQVPDAAVTSTTNKLLEYGIGGVFILFLALALYLVWRAYREEVTTRHTATVDALNKLTTVLEVIKDRIPRAS